MCGAVILPTSCQIEILINIKNLFPRISGIWTSLWFAILWRKRSRFLIFIFFHSMSLFSEVGVLAVSLRGVLTEQRPVWGHQRAHGQAEVDLPLRQPQRKCGARLPVQQPWDREQRQGGFQASRVPTRAPLERGGCQAAPGGKKLEPNPPHETSPDWNRALPADSLRSRLRSTRAPSLTRELADGQWAWVRVRGCADSSGPPRKPVGPLRAGGRCLGDSGCAGLAGARLGQLLHRMGAGGRQSQHVAEQPTHSWGPGSGIRQGYGQSTVRHPQTLGWKPAAQHALLQPQQCLSISAYVAVFSFAYLFAEKGLCDSDQFEVALFLFQYGDLFWCWVSWCYMRLKKKKRYCNLKKMFYHKGHDKSRNKCKRAESIDLTMCLDLQVVMANSHGNLFEHSFILLQYT